MAICLSSSPISYQLSASFPIRYLHHLHCLHCFLIVQKDSLAATRPTACVPWLGGSELNSHRSVMNTLVFIKLFSLLTCRLAIEIILVYNSTYVLFYQARIREQGTGNREQGTGNREQGTEGNYRTSHPLQPLFWGERRGIEGVGVVNTIMNEKKVPSPTQRMTRTSVGNPIRFTSRAGIHRAFRKITLVKVERNGTSRIPYCYLISFPCSLPAL